MGENLQEKCAISVAHTIADVYDFTKDQQHRGRDCIGISGIGPSIDTYIWLGEIGEHSIESISRILPPEKYHTFLGHARYITKGNKKHILRDAHPQTIGGVRLEVHGGTYIQDSDAAVVHNGEIDPKQLEGLDHEALSGRTDTASLLEYFMKNGIHGVVGKIPGAYTAAFAAKREPGRVVVVRDRTGIRPGVYGVKDGKHVAASEDIALRKNHARVLGDLTPGTAYYLLADGQLEKQVLVEPATVAKCRRSCAFEYQYFGDRESVIDGISVYHHRMRMARGLAEEVREKHDFSEYDFVTYIPDCPEDAARAFADELGLDFKHIFFKRRKKRSFIGPKPEERKSSLKDNLFVLPNLLLNNELKGKRAIAIEDSIVRGEVTRHIKSLAKQAEMEIFLLSYTPPVGILDESGTPTGCEYGVDIPPSPESEEQYLARGRDLLQIQEAAGLQLDYFSLQGMLSVFNNEGLPGESLCYRCMGGPKPF